MRVTYGTGKYSLNYDILIQLAAGREREEIKKDIEYKTQKFRVQATLMEKYMLTQQRKNLKTDTKELDKGTWKKTVKNHGGNLIILVLFCIFSVILEDLH